MVVLTSFPPPTDGIRHKEPQTEAFIESRNLGVGTLYIAESRVSWMSDDGRGFSLEYPAVSLHAISRDLASFPHECLYVMVEADSDAKAKDQVGKAETNRVAEEIAAFSIKTTSESNGSKDLNPTGQTNGDSNGHAGVEDEETEEDSEPSKITEIRFVPNDKSSLNNIFQAMSDCQILHPDENDSFSDEGEEYEDGSEYFSTADAVGYLNSEGQATLGRLSQTFELAQGNTEENIDEEMDEDTQVGRRNGHQVEEEAMEGQFDDAEDHQ